MKYCMKDNNLTLCISLFFLLISYWFLLFIGAIMSYVTLNTKHVEELVFRHLSGAFITSVTALVIIVLTCLVGCIFGVTLLDCMWLY